MYQAYRVRRRFGWNGWEYAPRDACNCGCPSCEGRVGTGCQCRDTICRCACGIPPERYGGDIWIVEAGHPRLEIMLASRFATGDASIPPVDDLLKEKEYQRLLAPPGAVISREPELAGAKRGPGRPAAPR